MTPNVVIVLALDAGLAKVTLDAEFLPTNKLPTSILRTQARSKRKEFLRLAEEWRVDTLHLSQISKKVLHPAYLRIIGMGEPAIPLLLEALRNRPDHWFVALKATSNADPVASGSTPAAARDAWLEWGRGHGLID